jgi:hypothetical protein
MAVCALWFLPVARHPNESSLWANDLALVSSGLAPMPSGTPRLLVRFDDPERPGCGQANHSLYTYTTGGATSNLGHAIQYKFNWGDNTDSNWLPVGVTSAQKAWFEGNTYQVKVRARCATDPSAVSSETVLSVKIELISQPNMPTGKNEVNFGDTSSYITGGASSNINDPIEEANCLSDDLPQILIVYLTTRDEFSQINTPKITALVWKKRLFPTGIGCLNPSRPGTGFFSFIRSKKSIPGSPHCHAAWDTSSHNILAGTVSQTSPLRGLTRS